METVTADEISTSKPPPVYSLLITNTNLHVQGMRVEWAKSKARMDHWQEEVTFLVEEMHRIIWYFDWRAGWWVRQSARWPNANAEVRNGIAAYFAKQATITRQLAKSFAV